jgi:hypothetical protein
MQQWSIFIEAEFMDPTSKDSWLLAHEMVHSLLDNNLVDGPNADLQLPDPGTGAVAQEALIMTQ